jgi:hypothetical protein
MGRSEYLNRTVPLPRDLTADSIFRAVEYVEKELVELVDIYFEQANVFSAIVGIYGVKALDSSSAWEKHKHLYTAQQRFPDLHRRRSSTPLIPTDCLESKGSKRVWELQAHYDHPGWYIVWRYLVDSTESFEPGRPVIIWRVDIVFLDKSDWVYRGSKASATGGGRTHTFDLKSPQKKLSGTAVYQRADVVLRRGKPVPRNGEAS